MKRSSKLMFANAPKSVRKFLHDYDKRRENGRFKMDHTVSRPNYVYDSRGNLVPYEGP